MMTAAMETRARTTPTAMRALLDMPEEEKEEEEEEEEDEQEMGDCDGR